MKNIYTILENIGVSIPEDKKAAFDTAFGENYKTVAEVEKITTAKQSGNVSVIDEKGIT